MKCLRLIISLFMVAAAAGSVLAAATSLSFTDPLDLPSTSTRLVDSTQLSAIALAGSRLVSVGVRGLVIVSDDQGQTWRQVPAPLSSDLVALRFVSATRGWAAGHDGAILATTDAGEHWSRQLDGRIAGELLTAHFAALAAQGDSDAARLQKEVARNYEGGPEIPMLDLWFEDERAGWAVGPFGTLLGTRDGGKTWESWIEKVDNPKMLHYNAVRGVGTDVYLASEQGLLFKLDRTRGRFQRVATGYKGSFFGVVGTREYVIAYGLRGSAYRSRDGGATWQALDTGVAGGLTAATVLADGRLLLVSQDGRLLISADQGDSFKPVPVKRPDLFTDVSPSESSPVATATVASPLLAVLIGLGGVQRAVLP